MFFWMYLPTNYLHRTKDIKFIDLAKIKKSLSLKLRRSQFWLHYIYPSGETAVKYLQTSTVQKENFASTAVTFMSAYIATPVY